jgi:hypothetical protein
LSFAIAFNNRARMNATPGPPLPMTAVRPSDAALDMRAKIAVDSAAPHFQDELGALQERLFTMGGLARDVEHAHAVLAEDDTLDALKGDITRELFWCMHAAPGRPRELPAVDPRLSPSRADRRSRHEPRRGRHLHGVRA